MNTVREIQRINEDLGEMSPDRYSALGKSRVRAVRRYTGEEPRRPTRRELADEQRLRRRSDRQSEADKRRYAKSRAEGKTRARRANSEANDSEKRKVKARFKKGEISATKRDELLRDVYRGFQWVESKAPLLVICVL